MKYNDVVYTIFTSGSTGEPKGFKLNMQVSLNLPSGWYH